MTDQPSLHPACAPGSVAVVTGAASGIGLAAARRYAALGMKVVIADRGGPALELATSQVASLSPNGSSDVLGMATDVSCRDDLISLRDAVAERFGPALSRWHPAFEAAFARYMTADQG